MNNSSSDFIKLAKHPVKFRMFLFLNLPAAFFSWVKIENISLVSCEVSIPLFWFTKNPFRSTYFACLSMAAELSTGALVMANIYKRSPKCSMLVTASSAVFVKKATGLSVFTCLDGLNIQKTIETAYLTNQPQSLEIQTIGKNAQNEIIATFNFTWSFKVKSAN